MPRFAPTVAAAASCLLGHPAFAGTTLVHVDDHAPAGGDGTSWAAAFRYLSDGIAAAAVLPPGDARIVVAGGTYRPDQSAAAPGGTGDRTATFLLPEGAQLVGGHLGLDASGGEDPYSRDVVGDPSALDGEIARPVLADNSLHIVTALGSGVVDGFTISNGWTEGGGSDGLGGGLRVEGDHAEPLVVRQCRLTANFAIAGGAAALVNSNAALEDCSFASNLSSGLRIEGGAPSLTDCGFDDNLAPSIGGGAWCTNASPTFANCSFTNHATGAGGGAYVGFGSATFTSCHFGENDAQGGGLFVHESTVTLLNCTFIENTSGTASGAMHTVEATVEAMGCRFADNTAGALAGANMNEGGDITYVECVFDGNVAAVGQGGAIVNNDTVLSCTDVEFRANVAAISGGAVYSFTSGFSASGSLFCANEPGHIEGPFNDLGGNTFTAECPATCPADVDGDGMVAVGDLLAVLAAWGDCPGCPADIDGDGVVAVGDLLAVLAAWGAC